MWNKPWKYKEGIAIGAGLVITGQLLQLTAGPIDWSVFAFPANAIALACTVLVLATIYALRPHVYLFRYLTTTYSATTALGFAALMTVIMGLTRQVPASMPATDAIGLTRMLSYWPFVWIYLWVTITVGETAIHQLLSMKRRNIPSLLCHAGLLLVLVTATLGSADMRRLKMICYKGQPEWRATDGQMRMHELPIAIQLDSFTIDQYPPRLLMADARGNALPEGTPQSLLLEPSLRQGKLLGWGIKIEQNISEAAPKIMDASMQYMPWMSSGAVSAVLVEATSPDGKTRKKDWISDGSYLFPSQTLTLTDSLRLFMPQREPLRYASTVQIFTKTGKCETAEIEVNKPFAVDGWKIYLLDYDKRMGRWSDESTFELVADPWLPAVYTGICLLLAGAVMVFITAQRRKEEHT